MRPQADKAERHDIEWTLSPRDHVHFVGIGGIGLSAIARILLQRGYAVSGSDLTLSGITEDLVQLGASVHHGHQRENIGPANLVVASSAIRTDNPEIVGAQERNIPAIGRGQMLAWLMKDRRGIAIAGTHGKTTTTAMIGLVLEEAGLDPVIVVGGIVPELGTNAKDGSGVYFVLEADEYDRTFLELWPEIAVVTSIEMDHPDCFADLNDMAEAFQRFLSQLPADGCVVAYEGDSQVKKVVELLDQRRVLTYGLGKDANWRALSLRQNTLGGSDFRVIVDGDDKGQFQLGIPGVHNVSNALAAIAVTDYLGLDLGSVRETLRHFQGVKRRFEVKGEVNGITVIDDYAHHPSEIRATLAGARERYPGRRIWVVFQPHTYSRTRALLPEFAAAFDDADRVIVTAIYAAREANSLGISADDLVRKMSHSRVEHIPNRSEVGSWVRDQLEPRDVLITMGAGDVWRVGEDVLALLQQSGK